MNAVNTDNKVKGWHQLYDRIMMFYVGERGRERNIIKMAKKSHTHTVIQSKFDRKI